MTAIQVLPKWESSRTAWKQVFGSEIPDIYWPWYTLIGTVVTVGVALGLGWVRNQPSSTSHSATVPAPAKGNPADQGVPVLPRRPQFVDRNAFPIPLFAERFPRGRRDTL